MKNHTEIIEYIKWCDLCARFSKSHLLIADRSASAYVCVFIFFLGSFILFAPIFEIKENRGHQSYYLRNRHTHSKIQYRIGAIGFVGCPIVIVLFDPIQPIIQSIFRITRFIRVPFYSIFMFDSVPPAIALNEQRVRLYFFFLFILLSLG